MRNRKSFGLLDDKIMAGIILGWVSNIPKWVVDTIMYKLHFSDFYCWHVTGGILIKGTLLSIFIWVFLCIMVIDQRISMYAKLYDPGHAYQSFIVHTLWGIVISYLAVKYARSTISKKPLEGHK